MAARQMAQDVSQSPFTSDPFDIPAYLRKKPPQNNENPRD